MNPHGPLLAAILAAAAGSPTTADDLPKPAVAPAPRPVATPLPGFRRSHWLGGQVREKWIEPGVRVLLNAAER